MEGSTFALALGVLAVSCGFLLPCIAAAQMLVRSDLAQHPLSDEPEVADDTPLPQPSEGTALNDVQTDRLIRKYIAEAGHPGPRKLFAGTKFDATFSVGEYYDDDILQSTTGGRQDDWVTTIAGGVSLTLGDVAEKQATYLLLGYKGTGSLFAKHGEEDSYDQDAIFTAHYRRPRLLAELDGRFQELHDATADLGQREGRRVYGEDLLVKEDYSDVTTLTGDVRYTYNDYDTGIDSSDLSLGLALDYEPTSKVTVGAGIVLGRLAASDDVEEWYQETQLRAGYSLTDKVTLEARLGVDVRERGAAAGTSATPVFSLTGKWTPLDGTTLSLNGYRQINASGADAGEDFIDTGVRVNLRQEVAQRFFLGLDAGYDNAAYQQVRGNGSPERSDDYFLLRAAAGYDFVRWFQLLAFYEHRQNESTRDNFSFNSNRYGMTATLLY